MQASIHQGGFAHRMTTPSGEPKTFTIGNPDHQSTKVVLLIA